VTRAPSVSVVICAYTERRWDELVDAITSVRRQTTPPLEVIVSVDYNPALRNRVAHRLPGVVIAENRQRQGLSGARNAGVALARGDVVAFLDDDAAAAPDWLERLSARYTSPTVLGVGGAIEPVWSGGRPRCFPKEFDWVVGCTYRGMPEAPTAVRNLIGANMSLRRAVLNALGGFRCDIGRIGTRPLGCEETELCIRAGRRWPEGVFLYDPSALVRHRVPASRASWRYFHSRCYAEGISKALVAKLADARSGLASERAYAMRVLPRGILRGVVEAITRGDAAGLGRSAMIAAGLAVTTAGYLVGTASRYDEESTWPSAESARGELS
jgi:glucosyl-dolichyl phosphate glucuronosyltransferase